MGAGGTKRHNPRHGTFSHDDVVFRDGGGRHRRLGKLEMSRAKGRRASEPASGGQQMTTALGQSLACFAAGPARGPLLIWCDWL